MARNAAVIIPVYKEKCTPYEAVSLSQCIKVLGSSHPLIVIKPASLKSGDLPQTLRKVMKDAVSFDDSYFRDVQGYSRLMLSEEFYKYFIKDYEYLLIHQLDAFVFRDELDYWCEKGFDYIGAPWLRVYPDIVKAAKNMILKHYHIRYNVKLPGSHIPTYMQFENMVGNGGFSLRRVEKLYSICRRERALIAYYNQHSAHNHFNEDVFWSIEMNRRRRELKIPGYRTALRFSIENMPERAMRLNKGKLPFGCHAWDLHPDYWRPWFAADGYEI